MAESLTDNPMPDKGGFLTLPRKGQNIIAIASGKSGTGKTWFSISLSYALNLCKQKVLLFDADNGIENINSQLGLDISSGLEKAINDEKSLNQIIYNYDKGHFDIITRKSESAGLSVLPIGRLQILGSDLCIIAENYDKVILDMSAGIEKEVRIISGMADSILVLCNAESPSLTEAYSYIKIMHEQYAKKQFMIVINQVNSIIEGERAYSLLQRACNDFMQVNLQLLGIIRKDARVRDAIKNKVPVISRYPTAEVSEDVWMIAKKLVEHG